MSEPDTKEEVLEKEIVRLKAYIDHLERQIFNQSWIDNPDRMGGAFSQDEIDRAKGDTWT